MKLNKILTTTLLLVSFASANDTLIKIINNNYDVNSSYKLVEASSEEKSRYAESIGMAYNQIENRFEAYASSAGADKIYDAEQDKFYTYEFVEKGFDYDCTTKTLKRPCPVGSEEFGNTSHCRTKIYSEPSCDVATPHYGNNGVCYSDEGLTCKNGGVLWTNGILKDTCFLKIDLFSLAPIVEGN